MKVTKKPPILVLALFSLTGCSIRCYIQRYYDVDNKWSYSFSGTYYEIVFSEKTDLYVLLNFKISGEEGFPLYFEKGDSFSSVEYNGITYSKIYYKKYLGNIDYNTSEFTLKCNFSKEYPNPLIDVDMAEGVSSLNLFSARMIHHFEIKIKPS